MILKISRAKNKTIPIQIPTKLSIIIVSWNAKKFLNICLKSIYKQTTSPFEIFVVDNNSEDGSQKMVEKYFPGVILVENKNNPGFGRANNQALELSTGEYVLFLNPDTKVEHKAIDKTISFLEKNPDVGMAGVRLVDKDGNPQFTAGRKSASIWGEICLNVLRSPFPKTKLFGGHLMSYWDHKDNREVQAICGAYMMIRTKLLKKLKGFDESYFMYGEDMDLCLRLKKAGPKIFYLGKIRMIHYGAKSSSRNPASILRTSLAGIGAMYHFFLKNKSPFYAKVYKFFIRFFALIELLIRYFLNLSPKFKDDEVKKIKIKLFKKILFWHLNYKN